MIDSCGDLGAHAQNLTMAILQQQFPMSIQTRISSFNINARCAHCRESTKSRRLEKVRLVQLEVKNLW